MAAGPVVGDDFAALQLRLKEVWRAIEARTPLVHTSVVVPSLSFDPGELAKIQGIEFYEERLLFTLIRLRDPRAHVIYVTSAPIHPEIVEYYLRLLPGVSAQDARSRLRLLSTFDRSARPLTEKILERPRLLARLRELIGDTSTAYLTCFNSSRLERDLALALGIPLNGVDPELVWLGTKSGSRDVFVAAGVECPRGVAGIHTRDDVVRALLALRVSKPIGHAVLKLDESFAGAGNAIFTYPPALPESAAERSAAIESALADLQPTSSFSTAAFLEKLSDMGGIVEEMIEGDGVRSPSVQMRVDPDGRLRLLSTHDQVLGGPIGQTYLGCHFPADEQYRHLTVDAALRIGQVLRDRGVVGRFGVDFVALREDRGWGCFAIEINLRMGGTTFPFLALQFLTGGELDEGTRMFRTARGTAKYYFATDNLRSESYRGLSPDDFMQIVARHDLLFDPWSACGPVFHMIGALSEYGRVGVTCIGDSRQQAERIYDRVVRSLDAEGASVGAGPAVLHPLDMALPME